MGTRSKLSTRCLRCRMRWDVCVCGIMPNLDLATRLVLIIHRRETKKTTNTGMLAVQALTHSRMVVRGDAVTREQVSDAIGGPERRTMLLFPADDAVDLTPELLAADPRPISLVVPDGNWRQAAKVGRRVPGLEAAERVKLPLGAPSRYRLRHEHRSDGMATMEAIARAMGIIEGAHVQEPLEHVFLTMVERTLWTRTHSAALPA